MTTTNANPNDVFWLARYAHNQLAPLFAKVTDIEPTTRFSIELHFPHAESAYPGNYVSVLSHWNRDGMFQYCTGLETKADVDRLAAKVAEDVDTLEVKVTA